MMNYRPAVKLVLVASLAFSAEAANAQAPAAAHKTPAPRAGAASTTAATKPPLTKKLSFADDTFSAKRKSLDTLAQNLSEQDLAAQKKAATDGAPDSMYVVGAYSLHTGDEAAAKQWWAQAAEKDSVFAMVALAELPSADAAERRKWLEKAAANGAPPAELHLGELLLESQGGPEQLAEGKKLLLKSAADGCVEAQNLVGASYLGLGAKYPGLFESNAALGQQYLQAAKRAHSAEARNTLRLAVEKGLLPDPFKGAPQLDSGDAFVAYLRKLDPDDRVLYLRQQIAKYPQSARRPKALEEVVWLAPNHTDEPEFQALRAQDPANLTVQMLSLAAELDRMQGHPQAEAAQGDVKSVADVIDRWRAASDFDRLAQHSYLLTHETVIVSGEENPHQINCATDLKNMREEEPDDFQITAAAAGRFQYYLPRENGENLKIVQALPQYLNSTTYLGNCLNLPASVRVPDQFKFAGIKTFMGARVYALAHNSGSFENYFDTKSFLYLGSQQSQGAWTESAFGYRDFGGAVLPQYVLFHSGNNIRLRKFTGLQWDQPPAIEGDIFTLVLTPYPQYPQSKWIKPVLADVITQNEITLQPASIQEQLDKLKATGDAQFGLDSAPQKDRRALLAGLQVQAAALPQNSHDWDQVATAVFGTVVQQDRQRRFKNPVNARDVYLNWQDVTNLNSLLAHKTVRVQLKHSRSGSNSESGYCARNDDGTLRSEGAGSLVLQNSERQISYGFDKKRGVTGPKYDNSTPATLRQNFLSSCLLGVDQASTTLSTVLQTSAFGTGTIYKRPAYVIFQKYTPNDSTDDATRYFFDKETFVLLGIQDGKDDSPVSYSDFKKVGDSILPFREYSYEGGQYPWDTIDTIEKLDLDVAIDAREFDLNTRAPQDLYAATLREKRPELYKTGPSPWTALATGALLGVAQGANNNPSLFASAQQAQLTSLQATILAHQIGGDLTKLAGPSFTPITPNQPAGLAGRTLAPGSVVVPPAPLMTPAQLQVLEGLILGNNSNTTGDANSSALLEALKQMAGQGNLIQETANQQAAAILAIGNANAAKQQQAAAARLAAQQQAQQAQQAAQQSTQQAAQQASQGNSSGGDTYASPLDSTCVKRFYDSTNFGWFTFSNNCGQKISVLLILNDNTDLLRTNLEMGASTDWPHDSASMQGHRGYTVYACPYPFNVVGPDNKPFDINVTSYNCYKWTQQPSQP